MKTQAEIVSHKVWVDPTGRTFSIFSSYVPPGSSLVERGYTIAWPDGTRGCGRPPFKTLEDARDYLSRVPVGFRGMTQY